MRIGILTHPQSINYGGILQCYALCSYLSKIGHDPIVIRREVDKSFFLVEWLRDFLKILHVPRYYNPNKIDKSKNLRPFIEKYIPRTCPIRSQSEMSKVCSRYHLDAVIVGSDQVWRRDFAIRFKFNYFLDFVPNKVIRMSYAASFGLSEWSYDEKETRCIRNLISRYSGVSVREIEAIKLLKENVSVKAYQHLDPTFLLSSEDYLKIASQRIENDDYIFVYWLGEKTVVKDKVQALENEGKKVVTLFLRDNIEHISVEDWLSYIKYSDSVITDSFHGCIFSILFEKNFTVLRNDSGGNGRISSLFKMFGIEDSSSIDYLSLKEKLQRMRQLSYDYINETLKIKCL